MAERDEWDPARWRFADGRVRETVRLAGAPVSLAAGVAKLLSAKSESRGNERDR